MRNLVVLLTAVAVSILSACGGSFGFDSAANGLPPDPGEDGLATVDGIDSDGDGVRDDIQRYIASEYPDSSRKRAALSQLAVALQDQLLSGETKQESLAAASRTMRAVECLAVVNTDVQINAKESTDLQAEVLNTQIRWGAYRLFDEQLWGEVVPSVPLEQHADSCTFDLNELAD